MAMKILLVNYEYPPLGGGGGIAMMEIAEELGKTHTVHVLTSGAPGLETTSRHPSADLTIHRVPVARRNTRATASFLSMLGFLPSGIRSGRSLLENERFDLINTWFAIPSGITGGWIARKQRVPHVLTVIGGDIYDPSKWYSPHRFPVAGAAVRWALRRADTHVAISSDIADRTRQYFGFDGKIEVIPLGIREPQYSPADRSALGLDPDKQYVVTVGRLVRRKDYPTLLRALGALRRDDVELLMIGDGPEQGNLQKLAADLGLEKRVRFLGFVSNEEKYRYLAASDLFVLASLHEGFGVVYLEAMFCGLPIIAADRGGQTDILENGDTGSLVPVGDVTRMTEALGHWLGRPEAAAQAGERNRTRARQYTIARVAERYERVFERAMGEVVPDSVNEPI